MNDVHNDSVKYEKGDIVMYYPIIGNSAGGEPCYVKEYYPEGIPSHPYPMVKLKGKSGLISCEAISPKINIDAFNKVIGGRNERNKDMS